LIHLLFRGRTHSAHVPAPAVSVARPERATTQIRPPVSAARRSGSPTVLTLPSIELVVSPFPTFREVGWFHQQLESLPCVRVVHLRRIQHGALQLRVECTGTGELLEELGAALNTPFGIISHEPHRIELLLYGSAGHDVTEVRGA
jgi:hypothetical protein